MSKKSLDRTIIEGGRTGRNKFERRYSNKLQRAKKRNFISKIKRDSELCDDIYIKDREFVYKIFDDKLGPIFRWLETKIGQNWNDIYSEIRSKFDVRTTAGRHIVEDHLLNSITFPGEIQRGFRQDDDTTFYKHDFFIDDNWNLQRKTYIPRNKRGWVKTEKIADYKIAKLEKWIANRGVVVSGKKIYWGTPVGYNNFLVKVTQRNIQPFSISRVPIYEEKIKFGSIKERIIVGYEEKEILIEPFFNSWGRPPFDHIAFLQGKEFTKEEYNYWWTIPSRFRLQLVKNASNK